MGYEDLTEEQKKELAESYRERAEEDRELCDAMNHGPELRYLNAEIEKLKKKLDIAIYIMCDCNCYDPYDQRIREAGLADKEDDEEDLELMLLIRSTAKIEIEEVGTVEAGLETLLYHPKEYWETEDWVIVGSHDIGSQMDPDDVPYIVKRKQSLE